MGFRPELAQSGAGVAHFGVVTSAPIGHEDGHRVTLWPDPPEWKAHAACRGSDVNFFPGRGDHLGVAACRAICAGCPVRDDCLAEALETASLIGIWGGTSEKERRALRRQRRGDAA